ncbi:MAG: Galactose-1-phosphate uridylyltransferase [candidate division BRC1 bacterium ADurb.BinA364]|nr:MAG: Galactose-1-phosphate uridylyltransferase [candidate division BRC1 bacterium ADurb.BinA364]
MPELRKDPVLGRWVIIATERANRPSAYSSQTEIAKKYSFCPFCAGNEEKTPSEVLSYRTAGTKNDSPGWWVRVVPNKFPALLNEGPENRVGIGMFDKMNGVGYHEVVIETPEHSLSLADLPAKQAEEVIWAYRDRLVELRKDHRVRYAMIFKNHGSEAGASLDHPHSQIIALPVVPKRVQEELDGARQYYNYKERCVFCDIIRQEQSDGVRVVSENDLFICIAPFAARLPFESWILPKDHSARFADVTKNQVVDLGELLHDLLRRFKTSLDDPPYNYMIHTLPTNESNENFYHWHIEVIPKLTRTAGFEWGTGFYINPTPPEDAARILREAAETSAETPENGEEAI